MGWGSNVFESLSPASIRKRKAEERKEHQASARNTSLQRAKIYSVIYTEPVWTPNLDAELRLREWRLHKTPRLKAAKLAAKGAARMIQIMHADWRARPRRPRDLSTEYWDKDDRRLMARLEVVEDRNDETVFDNMERNVRRTLANEADTDGTWNYVDTAGQNDRFEDEDQTRQEVTMRFGELEFRDVGSRY